MDAGNGDVLLEAFHRVKISLNAFHGICLPGVKAVQLNRPTGTRPMRMPGLLQVDGTRPCYPCRRLRREILSNT